jgi:hypothetical protein
MASGVRTLAQPSVERSLPLGEVEWTDHGVRPKMGCMRWYWWTAISVGLLLMILAAVAVTSFLNFLHTAN